MAGGLIFPLFAGFKTVSEVKRARAQVSEKESELAAVRQRLDEMNAQLDEIIRSTRVRLEHLNRERSLAEEGFSLAKKRYFSFQGSLVDIRESLRNIVRARTQINDALTEYLEASEGKALLNRNESN